MRESQIREKDKFVKDAINFMVEKLAKESIEEIQTYDVKDEFINAEKMLKEQNPIKKFLLYREEAPKKYFDCDVALRSIVIYQLIWKTIMNNSEINLQKNWNSNKYKYEINKGEMILTGETLQSFWTTYKIALQKLTPGYWEICEQENIKQLSKGITSNFEKFSLGRLQDLFIRWSKLVHSVGGFLPVPKGINQARYGMTLDYWDLTIYIIYLWYQNKRNNFTKVFGDSSRDCEKWLKQFKDKNGRYSWNVFVEKNYLVDFVSQNGKPLEFFPNHFSRFEELLEMPSPNRKEIERLLLPRDEKEIEYFLINVIEATEMRGKTISKEIKKKLEKVKI